VQRLLQTYSRAQLVLVIFVFIIRLRYTCTCSLAWPDRFLGAGRYRLQYKRLRLKKVWYCLHRQLVLDTLQSLVGVDCIRYSRHYYLLCATHLLPRVRREPLEIKGLSDVNNQHPPVSGGCQEQVAYANNTRPFLGVGAYTASDNALRLKSGLATRDYLYMPVYDDHACVYALHG